jgi:hypothetical protein
MSKRASTLEWQVAKDDTDWIHLCTQTPPGPEGAPAPNAGPAAQGRLFSKRFLWEVAAILLLLASAGGWWWRAAQTGSHPAAAKLAAPAQQELEAIAQNSNRPATNSAGAQSGMDRWYLHARELNGLRTAVQTADPNAHLDVVLHTVDFLGDQAVARVVTTTSNRVPAHRQTRFYRRTAKGWRQTAPDAALWGPERSLETPSLIFHFRQNDSQAVIAVAPQVDALYTTLRRNFGRPILFGTEKRVIEVSVTQIPGHATPWFHVPSRFLVSSPAVYLAPVELTDAELLAQSLVLPLLAQVLAQASDQHQIGAAWQPMASALYLWQVWDLDLPLAAWREEVVRWLYLDLSATPRGQLVSFPDDYIELCAAHRLWMSSPALIEIPFVCSELDQEAWLFPSWSPREPLTHLGQLPAPLRPNEYMEGSSLHRLHHPGHTVALATLIEYAAVTYGRERLPVLVAGLGQYESWDELIPAVYGVSPAEFEAGWQAYLAAHYGVRRSSQCSALDPRCARSQESAGEGKDRRIAFSQKTGCST